MNNANNSEHLKLMLEKLKKLQAKSEEINGGNDNKFNTNENYNRSNNLSQRSEKNKLLSKKLEELKQKRMEIERAAQKENNHSLANSIEANQYLQNYNYMNSGNLENDRIADMEFIAERGYSRTSYLKVLSVINGIKENVIKLSSIPSLEKIISNNLIVSNGLNEVVVALEKVLPSFFEKIIENKVHNLETTNQIKNTVSDRNVLERIEKQIDSLVDSQNQQANFSRNDQNVKSSNQTNKDELDALELEMNLINNLLFKK